MTDFQTPYNDDFANNPDRDYIGGAYSTFNPTLSKLAKDVNRRKASHTALYMFARSLVDPKKAKAYNKYIYALFDSVIYEDEILKKLQEFDSLAINDKIQLGQDIICKAIKKINLDHGNVMPKISVTHASWIDFARAHEGRKAIQVNLSDPDKPVNANLFILMLQHEITHMIDYLAPQLSPLGAQIAHISKTIYKTSPKLMMMNPLECLAYEEHWKFGKPR